nr:hypothetical protein [Tanacetum cinerariifolium]
MLMVDNNVGNQFRQNALQNVGNLVGQNAVQNEGIQNVRNQNGLSVISRIANQYRNGNVEIAPVDRKAEVQLHDNCYNDEIFNMFTQEEQYTELLEPIPEPHQVQQNDSNVIYAVFSVEQGGGTVEQYSTTVEEMRAYHELIFHNLAAEVEKVK